MRLESRVFSHDRIKSLMEKFVYVKVDPAKSSADQDALRYKSTRYVPEVVFLSSDGEVLDRLQDRSVDGTAETMESVLERVEDREEW